jgi:hypothetical protein
LPFDQQCLVFSKYYLLPSNLELFDVLIFVAMVGYRGAGWLPLLSREEAFSA